MPPATFETCSNPNTRLSRTVACAERVPLAHTTAMWLPVTCASSAPARTASDSRSNGMLSAPEMTGPAARVRGCGVQWHVV